MSVIGSLTYRNSIGMQFILHLLAVMAGISKSENRKGSGVIGVVLAVRSVVVDLSVVLVVTVVVVVVGAVDAIVGGNLLRLLRGWAISFGLFLREVEKLAFFAGLKNKSSKLLQLKKLFCHRASIKNF